MPDAGRPSPTYADWEPFCRYIVVVHGFGDERWEYPVCPRFGALKAIGLAMRADLVERGPRSSFGHHRDLETINLHGHHG